MQFNEFLVSFGKMFQLEDLKADESGHCAITVDDMVVHLQEVAELDQVVVYGELGELPAEQDGGFYRALLEANYLFTGTRGGTIALRSGSPMLVLQRAISDFSQKREDVILQNLEDFVNAQEELVAFVRDYRGQADKPAAEALPAGGTGDNFIRI